MPHRTRLLVGCVLRSPDARRRAAAREFWWLRAYARRLRDCMPYYSYSEEVSEWPGRETSSPVRAPAGPLRR